MIALDGIIAKLRNEGAEALSDSELERCLGNCIGALKLIPLAKEYRDLGILKDAALIKEVRQCEHCKTFNLHYNPYINFWVCAFC